MLNVFLFDTSLLDNDEYYEKMLTMVSSQRREKALRFYFRKDRNLCLGAGYLLDIWLKQEHIPDARFARHKNGKPYIENYPKLHYNISHSGHFAVLADADHEVGVDIEQILPGRLTVADRFLTPQECRCLSNQPTELAREHLFYRLWTLKESFMKVTGLGFELALNRFSILLNADGSISVNQSISTDRFCFYEFDAPEGYKLSVCTIGPQNEKRLIHIPEIFF